MTEVFNAVLAWVTAHPLWAQILLFFVAFAEGVFLLSALVPAAVVIFGMGALVAVGAMDLWSTIAIATAGAVVGDGLSFWLGRRYGARLFEWEFLKRRPEVIANGRRFFARHGGKGVVVARFIAPLRAVMPSLAGASGMPAWLFLLADGIAGFAWTVAYVFPGMLFGASIGLAAEVAGRLAILLLSTVILSLAGLWLTLTLSRLVQDRAARWLNALLDWSRRHRRLGVFGAALADPNQPETPALALIAAILVGVAGLFLHFWASAGLHPYPTPVDAAVFQALRDLHTPAGIAVAQALLELGQWPVYGAVGIGGLLVLLLLHKSHAWAHWVAALGFAAVIAAALHAIPTVPPPLRYFELADSGFAARDLLLSTVIYTFVAVLMATQRPLALRVTCYGIATVLLLLIAASQLYLGAQWLSLALFMLAIGVVWVVMLALGYRRHQPDVVAGHTFLLPLLLVFGCAAGVQWSDEAVAADPQPAAQRVRTVSFSTWRQRAWRTLPAQRADVAGRPKQALELQWAGALHDIEARLRAAGWQRVTPASPLNSLRWLTASTPIDQLPVLPQVHAGAHQVLALRLPRDADHQYLIRLWPSGLRLAGGEPIWVGSVTAQRAQSFYRLWRYPVTENYRGLVEPLLGGVPGVERTRVGEVWLLRPTPSPGNRRPA